MERSGRSGKDSVVSRKRWRSDKHGGRPSTDDRLTFAKLLDDAQPAVLQKRLLIPDDVGVLQVPKNAGLVQRVLLLFPAAPRDVDLSVFVEFLGQRLRLENCSWCLQDARKHEPTILQT